MIEFFKSLFRPKPENDDCVILKLEQSWFNDTTYYLQYKVPLRTGWKDIYDASVIMNTLFDGPLTFTDIWDTEQANKILSEYRSKFRTYKDIKDFECRAKDTKKNFINNQIKRHETIKKTYE